MSVKRKVEEIDKDTSFSLQDVIAEDTELEDAADAVLGASDDQDCTYPKGYVKRQALYACYTCNSTNDPLAGICLACSLECHNGHNLYELYTKRNFRCDCGNEKFSSLRCKLFPDKAPTNDNNCYNQNFRGLYCTCSRPYPDDEDNIEDEMIQCIVCEDWYHSRHLGETSIENLAFSEMICFKCSKRCSFLLKYSALLLAPTKLEKDIDNIDVNVDDSEALGLEIKDKILPVVHESKPSNTEQSASGISCKIFGSIPVKITGATFWPHGWRSVLCNCQSCLETYEKLQVSFLLDEQDTVSSYEEEGKKKALQKKRAQEENAFAGMSRFLQVEMLSGYKDMKEAFYEHFKRFAEEGTVVTEADVRKFFNSLKSKRQKVNVPYNCR